MIRQATDEDFNDVARLLVEFTRVSMDTDISVEEFREPLSKCIADGVALVSDTDGVTGVILGHYTTHPFWKKTMLQEVIWYATDNSGGALLREFIRTAKQEKCDAIHLTVFDTAGERIHAGLKRLGFEPLERSYIMKL